jgi:hypothetical protein
MRKAKLTMINAVIRSIELKCESLNQFNFMAVTNTLDVENKQKKI